MKLSLQAKANILKVVAVAIFVFIIYSVSGCSSSCRSTKRYWRKHRCVQATPKTQQLNHTTLIWVNTTNGKRC